MKKNDRSNKIWAELLKKHIGSMKSVSEDKLLNIERKFFGVENKIVSGEENSKNKK